MSVRETHGLACPICHHDDRIEVTFTGTCLLTGSGSEDNGDHEWDESSPCMCRHCYHMATVNDFLLPPGQEPADTGEANEPS